MQLRSFLKWLFGAESSATPDTRDKTKSLVTTRDRFYQLLMESAKGSLERWQAAAQATRNAAAAIGVIYAAVLGVAFSVDNPLPPRGLIAAIFLGLALVMATAYEAYPTRSKKIQYFPEEDKPDEDPLEDAQRYAATYIEWVTVRVNRNMYALRVAIMSLALAVAALPLGFVSLGTTVGTTGLPPWPDPPVGFETELANTLYKAQVAEVASQRETVLHADPGESFDNPGIVAVYILFGVALLVALLHPVPGAIRRRLGKRAAAPPQPPTASS